jgi:hypothetical protein
MAVQVSAMKSNVIKWLILIDAGFPINSSRHFSFHLSNFILTTVKFVMRSFKTEPANFLSKKITGKTARRSKPDRPE